jgi:hypothetical protein
MWLLVILSCAPSGSPDFGAGGDRGDSGYVGGNPTGADDSSGGGDDTGAGGDDTGTPICDADDLDLVVLVEDAAGDTGTAFSGPLDVTTRAVFTNPCDGLLRFTTPDGCLVNAWTLTDGVGSTRSSVDNCVQSETTWSFQGFEGTSVTVDWGELGRSTYKVEAYSAAVGRSATEFFSVQ